MLDQRRERRFLARRRFGAAAQELRTRLLPFVHMKPWRSQPLGQAQVFFERFFERLRFLVHQDGGFGDEQG
jgi:uracil-DNA glycosylase